MELVVIEGLYIESCVMYGHLLFIALPDVRDGVRESHVSIILNIDVLQGVWINLFSFFSYNGILSML